MFVICKRKLPSLIGFFVWWCNNHWGASGLLLLLLPKWAKSCSHLLLKKVSKPTILFSRCFCVAIILSISENSLELLVLVIFLCVCYLTLVGTADEELASSELEV